MLSSDHTATIIEYRNKLILYSKPETPCNKTTKWQPFKETIESKIYSNIPLKTPEHIEQAVATLKATIQEAARTTTTHESTSRQTNTIPQKILDKIREKGKAKAKWQKHRTRENKNHLNKLAKEIKNKIKEHNNTEFGKFIGTLSTHENSNYSLWKATKKIKKPIIPVPAIRKQITRGQEATKNKLKNSPTTSETHLHHKLSTTATSKVIRRRMPKPLLPQLTRNTPFLKQQHKKLET